MTHGSLPTAVRSEIKVVEGEVDEEGGGGEGK